jgi:hypothetical protein
VLALASCSTVPTTTKPTPGVKIDPDRLRIISLLQWLDQASLAARSLRSEGSITASNSETSQSGNFTLKSKRLSVLAERPSHTERVDSLSVEVTGPFGITVARFMASPESYAFSDILHGDTRRGPTDDKSLKELTQLEGISLETMSDVLYGLAPGADTIGPTDSLTLYTRGETRHILLIRRLRQNYSEAITIEGGVQMDSLFAPQIQSSVVQYDLWNGIIAELGSTTRKPEVNIKYRSHTIKNGFFIPMEIEARTKDNTLLMQYEEATVNPNDLVVKIKMPK